MSRRQPDVKLGTSDYWLLGIIIALLCLGLLMVYSTTYFFLDDDPYYFLARQMVWVVLGAGPLLFFWRLDYHQIRRFSVFIMGGTLLMLVVILLVGGEKLGGQRWLLQSGSIQPSEIAKLAVIIYVADWLSGKGEQIKDVTLGLIPFAILIGFITGLILLQPDFSTSMIVVGIAVTMFFIAGAELAQLGIGLMFGGATLAIILIQAPYRLSRLSTFMDPLADPSGKGYQIGLTLQALVNGGFGGRGLGNSVQKLMGLPLPHTDSIFAIMGEELGLLGSLMVMGLFAALAYRGLRIALKANDPFGAVLATGITCWITLQALVNIGGITATIPFTGIPLPFISYGGSALVSTLAATGILLSISRNSRVAAPTGKDYASFNIGWRYRGPRLSRLIRR